MLYKLVASVAQAYAKHILQDDIFLDPNFFASAESVVCQFALQIRQAFQ